ncbi:MAG TPA: recombination mediator RecR [Gemmatimonadota bacterium]|nr:recombination mediator RecR [Gemmatimonadota bacterium]
MAGAVEQLIEELSRLPGIGRKTASRLTFYILKQPRESASRLSDAILQVKDRISFCETCGNIAEGRICTHCLDPRRDDSVICVVEEPSDIHVIEKSGGFRGRYHVLHGRLSPLDGVGPESLNVDRLTERVRQGDVQEVILATNPDVEGEATALYLRRALAPLGVRVTRIARGIPMGGSLEFLDEMTVGEALAGRREL